MSKPIEHPSTLIEQGAALYDSGDKKSALLCFKRAQESALDIGEPDLHFTAQVYEALAWRAETDYRRALGTLISALITIPPTAPPRVRFLAQKSCVELQLSGNPTLSRINRQMDELIRLGNELLHPESDIHHLLGKRLFYRGEWSDALVQFSLAWQKYDGHGYVRHRFPLFASRCCLMMANRADAVAWHAHLSETDQHRDDGQEERQANRIRLSLFDNDGAEAARCLSDELPDHFRELQGRAQLLLRGHSIAPMDDPDEPSHPAHKLIVLERTQDVHDRYDNLLALLDFRLACVRFTVGLPAMDDLYYRKPDAIPLRLNAADPAKLGRQFHNFRFTWHLLLRHAKRLDVALECNWRTREATARHNRIEAIAAACNLPLTSAS